jgi:hypothetical protein
MNYETLVGAVQAIGGASFLGMDTLTPVKLTGGKKNPMQGRVTKSVIGAQVIVYGNESYNGYISMIKNRLIAEGKEPEDYTPGVRPWGQRIPNMPIVEHTKDDSTKYYLEAVYLKPGKSFYFIDGDTPIEASDIEGLEAPKVSETSQGGLENKVIVRTVSAENIVEIRVDKTKFN